MRLELRRELAEMLYWVETGELGVPEASGWAGVEGSTKGGLCRMGKSGKRPGFRVVSLRENASPPSIG